jgi:hypothetical protein
MAPSRGVEKRPVAGEKSWRPGPAPFGDSDGLVCLPAYGCRGKKYCHNGAWGLRGLQPLSRSRESAAAGGPLA